MSKPAWKELEREVVRRLRIIGFQAKRLWEVQFTTGNSLDIRAEKGNLKLAIQCKHGKKPNLKKAWLEALNGKSLKEMPVGICRFKGEKNTLVIISFSDFLKLLNGE